MTKVSEFGACSLTCAVILDPTKCLTVSCFVTNNCIEETSQQLMLLVPLLSVIDPLLLL